jgi:hypothetical protein
MSTQQETHEWLYFIFGLLLLLFILIAPLRFISLHFICIFLKFVLLIDCSFVLEWTTFRACISLFLILRHAFHLSLKRTHTNHFAVLICFPSKQKTKRMNDVPGAHHSSKTSDHSCWCEISFIFPLLPSCISFENSNIFPFFQVRRRETQKFAACWTRTSNFCADRRQRERI